MAPRAGSIGEIWEVYRTSVLPEEAPEIQVTECRRAFYAGARGALYGLDIDQTDDVTEHDLELVDSICDELDHFLREVESGRA